MRRLNLYKDIREIPFERGALGRFVDLSSSPFDEIFTRVLAALEVGTACAEVVIFDDDEVAMEREKLVIKGTEFYTGAKVASYLFGCNGAALFICTLGSAFDGQMKSFREDPVEAYFADAIGSLMCEAFADTVHDYVFAEATKVGLSATNRYSPGYCNWNVNEQQKLFSFFRNSKTGIILNDSSLMLPIKSISGLIGIGKGIKQTPYACTICADAYCPYRRVSNL